MLRSKGLIFCVLISIVCLGDAIRTKRTSLLGDDANIHTEYVDRNNRTIWAMFNLTEEQLSRIMAGNNANGQGEATNPRDSQYFNHIKEARINDIRTRLESAFDAGSNSDENQETSQHPRHEVAAYPLCNAESNSDNWLQDNNVTIQFSNSILEMKSGNLNLDSAILRLYKMNPNGTDEIQLDEELTVPTTKGCSEPLLESQIRVTVSIIQQLRRNKQRKKRICNTMMLSVSKTGWIEIDIKRAIYIWEQVMRDQHTSQTAQQQQQHQTQQMQHTRPPVLVGWLMIEVHDEEERPLKPGLFFKPPNCKQADFAIPWNYYGSQTLMPNLKEANQVPRYPRLDVRLIGYASFAPKNYNININKKFHENLLHQLNNLSKNNNNNNDNNEEATVNQHASTTTNTVTNNLLNTLGNSNEILHQHRKCHQEQNVEDTQLLANTDEEELKIQQHYHQHHRYLANSNEMLHQQRKRQAGLGGGDSNEMTATSHQQHRKRHHQQAANKKRQHHHHQQHFTQKSWTHTLQELKE